MRFPFQCANAVPTAQAKHRSTNFELVAKNTDSNARIIARILLLMLLLLIHLYNTGKVIGIHISFHCVCITFHAMMMIYDDTKKSDCLSHISTSYGFRLAHSFSASIIFHYYYYILCALLMLLLLLSFSFGRSVGRWSYILSIPPERNSFPLFALCRFALFSVRVRIFFNSFSV